MEQSGIHLMETLLSELLTLTLQLEESIYREESDPEEWVRIIGERQSVIDQVASLQEQGVLITSDQKRDYISRVSQMDSVLIPAMELKKSELQRRIHNMNKSKAINQQYMGGSGYNPYGSFFDKKK